MRPSVISRFYRPGRYRTTLVDRVNVSVILRKYLRMFRQRWWIPVLLTLLGSGGAVYWALTTPDSFQAYSKLGIAPRIAFTERYTDKANVIEEMNNFAANQIQYMEGNEVLGKVYEKMQDFRLPDGRAPLFLPQAGQGRGSTFILTVNSDSAEFARRAARTWAQEFLAFKDEQRNVLARKETDRTRTDLARQEERVAESRQRMEEFFQENRIGTSDDVGNDAQSLLSDLQRRLQGVVIERQRLESKSVEELADDKGAALATGDAGTPGEFPAARQSGDAATDPFEKYGAGSNYTDLKRRLSDYQAEVERHRAFLRDQHPYMQRFQRYIADTERQIREQLKLIEEMRQARVSSMKQEEKFLEEQINRQREEVVRLRGVAREFSRLREDLDKEQAIYLDLSKKLSALSQMQPDDELIQILEQGVGSDKPVAPNRPQIIVLGIFGSLVAGLLFVFLLAKLDDRVESAEELEKQLQEPVLGQLPLVASREVKAFKGLVSVAQLPEDHIFSESLRGVRSSVMFAAPDLRKQVLLVTSSVPGDGKTTFTVNFAITLAKAGHKVLLLDADMRRGTVTDYFGIKSEPGLSDVLAGVQHWSEVMHRGPTRSLMIVPRGSRVQNPGELLLSRAAAELVAEARKEFDYVIFDCPPVIGMDDAFSLVSHGDGFLFVFRVGETSLKIAKHAVAGIRQRGAQIIGLILNGISLRSPDYYYTAYYYSNYTYNEDGQRVKRSTLAPGAHLARPRRGSALLEEMRHEGNGAAAPGDSTDGEGSPAGNGGAPELIAAPAAGNRPAALPAGGQPPLI
ncbi:MAG: GumC family protein [Limisphaerales bacterium]